METIKQCPQCGIQFQGRSNKRYCSDKCKLSAFKDAKTLPPQSQNLPTIVSMPTIPKNQSNLKLKNEPTIMLTNERNEADVLRLQIELRKMELTHEIRLAEMAGSENDKQRNFELEKLRFHAEKEKQHQPPKMEEAKKIPIQKAKEAVLVEIIDFIPLPQKLIERYNLCAIQFLEREGEMLNINDIGEFADYVIEISKDIRRFIIAQKIDEDGVMEYAYLKKISNMLDDTADTIMRESLSAMAYRLDEELRKELESSLE